MAGAYWPAPWTCEDGGPRRWCCATGQAGLGILPCERLEVAAVRDAFGREPRVSPETAVRTLTEVWDAVIHR